MKEVGHIYDSLTECYDEQAQHFHHTRKKTWPEVDTIFTALQSDSLGGGKFLDLGCGTGRLVEYVSTQLSDDWKYQGVDISSGMIEVAKKEYPNADFIAQDMYGYLKDQQQEAYRCIVSLAAFQHLPTLKERRRVLSHMYRVLEWGGSCFLVNRSFSQWFLKKYRKQVIYALFSSVLPPRTSAWNDVNIPWKDPNYTKNKKMYTRYYHIFTLHELTLLVKEAGFSICSSGYIDQNGLLSDNWKTARNSFFHLKKDIRK